MKGLKEKADYNKIIKRRDAMHCVSAIQKYQKQVFRFIMGLIIRVPSGNAGGFFYD